MFDLKFLKAVALKAVYVVIAAAAMALMGWLDAHPDIGLWTFDSLKIAVGAAVVAALKRFVGNWFVNPN
jgi:hypothetical protein